MSKTIEHWFHSKTLPWTAEIENFFDDKGYKTVEQLKFLKKEQWDELFAEEKDVVKFTADQVYNDYLHGQKVDLKKAASELHLKQAAPGNKTPAKRKAPHKDDGSSKKMASFGFTVKVIKTAQQKRNEKTARREQNAGEAISNNDGEDGGGDDGGDAGSTDEDDDIDDDNNRKLPALPPSDWRSCRCALSKDLNDPVPSDWKLAFDPSLLPEDKRPSKDVTDLEDTFGYYKAVGGCDKTTSDTELKSKVENELNNARRKMARFHQDRAETADANKYTKWKGKYDMLKRVRDHLCKEDDNGCLPNRVAYDERGEKLIDLMVEVSVVVVLSLLFPCNC